MITLLSQVCQNLRGLIGKKQKHELTWELLVTNVNLLHLQELETKFENSGLLVPSSSTPKENTLTYTSQNVIGYLNNKNTSTPPTSPSSSETSPLQQKYEDLIDGNDELVHSNDAALLCTSQDPLLSSSQDFYISY